jgi:hypothetical protein
VGLGHLVELIGLETRSNCHPVLFFLISNKEILLIENSTST